MPVRRFSFAGCVTPNRAGAPGHPGRIATSADHVALALARHHVADRIDVAECFFGGRVWATHRLVGVAVRMATLEDRSPMMPISQGGIGVREATLVALLAPFGATSSLAFAAGLVFQTIIISGGLLGGLLAMVLGRGSLFPTVNNGQVPNGQELSLDFAGATARSEKEGAEKKELGR